MKKYQYNKISELEDALKDIYDQADPEVVQNWLLGNVVTPEIKRLREEIRELKKTRRMTEHQLSLLGFEKNLMDNYEDDTEYYYSYDIVRGLSLITNTNEEAEKSGWKVEIFETEPTIQLSGFEKIQAFINSMESQIVKKED